MAKSADSDEKSHSVSFHLGLHIISKYLLTVSFQSTTGDEIINLFSYSTQLSMKFQAAHKN